jgi:hypothetical protein
MRPRLTGRDEPDDDPIEREQTNHPFVRVGDGSLGLEFASHISLQSLHHTGPELIDSSSVEFAFGADQWEGFLADIGFDNNLIASADCFSDPIRHTAVGESVVHRDIGLE